MKTLYTAHAKNTGGRHGHSETDDGALKVDLASPGAADAKPGSTNPEQIFACGYSACFGSALEQVAKKQGVDASGAVVSADVSLNQDDNGYFISVVLEVTVPSIDQPAAEKLVEATHQVCPYSKATRGNIDVTLKANGKSLAKAA
jgi:lipoyl-dependent peroxiredoxin